MFLYILLPKNTTLQKNKVHYAYRKHLANVLVIYVVDGLY